MGPNSRERISLRAPSALTGLALLPRARAPQKGGSNLAWREKCRSGNAKAVECKAERGEQARWAIAQALVPRTGVAGPERNLPIGVAIRAPIRNLLSSCADAVSSARFKSREVVVDEPQPSSRWALRAVDWSVGSPLDHGTSADQRRLTARHFVRFRTRRTGCIVDLGRDRFFLPLARCPAVPAARSCGALAYPRGAH